MFDIIIASGLGWFMLSLLNKKPKQEASLQPELPKLPAGPGIERRVIRQYVSAPDGSQVLLSEVVKFSGVDEQGQLIDEQEERSITLSCGHGCRSREGYGGRCRRCGASHCTLAECSVNCVNCGEAFGRTSEGKR